MQANTRCTLDNINCFILNVNKIDNGIMLGFVKVNFAERIKDAVNLEINRIIRGRTRTKLNTKS